MANVRQMGQEYKRRQYQADERQVEHDVLSLADKIEKAQSRRGESKREIARLTELLAESVNPQKRSPKRNKQ
ncbi:MAG: hypothetical protein ACKVIO_00180 [Phycisphaerales bacterium]|jgi:hypothetical protein|tara:strand:- start:201 stop:416 length:216 start_codon:yes stop_codon:yes gene_type:complete